MLASLIKSKIETTAVYHSFGYRIYLLRLCDAVKDYLRVEAYQPLAEALRDTVLDFMESGLSDEMLKNISTGDVRTFTFLHERILSTVARAHLRQAKAAEDEALQALYHQSSYVYQTTE